MKFVYKNSVWPVHHILLSNSRNTVAALVLTIVDCGRYCQGVHELSTVHVTHLELKSFVGSTDNFETHSMTHIILKLTA